MIFSKIAGDISEIAGDLAISEQSVKKIIIPALAGSTAVSRSLAAESPSSKYCTYEP